MASFYKMGMAEALSANNHIAINRSFFGLRQTVKYTPTQSTVNLYAEDFSADDGAKLERLLELAPSQLEKEVKAHGKPGSVPLGPYRLEACVSEDRQFCALQLFHFVDFSYTPSTDPKFYEGKDAEQAAAII